MNEDRPYHVEYAKSGQSGCKVCFKSIAKDSLRIAALVQNSYHDGKSKKWHHTECFFQEHRVKTTGDIAHFDSIRWDDQEYIKQKIEENRGTTVSESGSRKRSQAAAASAAVDHLDFKAEYSKVDRTECHGCGWSMKMGDIRLSKKTEEGLDRWYDVDCFAQLRSEMRFFDDVTSIPGVSELTEKDQDILRRALPIIEKENVPPGAKKMKSESEDAEEEESLKIQQQELFSVRDELKSLKKKELTGMLRANNQNVPVGLSEILDTLADALLFGALEPCPKCGGQFVFKSGTGYKCTGNVSEWVLCENIAQDPKRKKFAISEDLKEEHPFLSKLKPKVQRRLLKITAPSSSSSSSFSEEKQDDVTDGSETTQSKPRPLKYLTFVLTGFTEDKDEKLTRDIVSMGGTVKPKVNANITAVIATQGEVEKMSRVVEEAKKRDIHVVSEDFVEAAKELISGALKLIEEMSITGWGSYPWMRVMNSIAMNSVPIDKSHYEKSSSDKRKLRVKGGATVDPDSKLDDVAHVYQRGDEIFTASLGETSVQRNRNSFYKLQILKHDKEKKYWLFRSYGRIGTKIGNIMCEDMTLKECIKLFEETFEEKTGNRWRNRKFFQKKPNKYYLMIPDADHGDENTFGFLDSNVESTMKKPVQDLMRLIFDIGLMKKAMMEYEIDTAKMPLGKISKKQIQEAHCVLSRLLLLVNSESQNRTKIIEETNKFYTLIPHNFGVDGPKLIETEMVIQKKREMLESLLEMNIAYKLVHSEMGTDRNPLDVYYEQLKTNIDVLDRESDEFKLIEKYVKNTHAETHDEYKLVVEEVFVAKRDGEESRYEAFKDFPNRKLLWHGSRVTNFAGILSQGLRIAPPEAPPTGYMFGKGVYFADMVSKSANYCRADAQNSTGLLLLCEVALGNMYERFRGERELPATLPDGCHSTWGRGKTQPDPERSVKLETGVEVPCGPGIPAELEQESKLLYNEFIVYDVPQLKVEYIVRMKFEYEEIRNDVCLR